MNGFPSWRHRTSDIAAELRARRPQPRSEFARSLSAHVAGESRRSALHALSRLSFAGALTVLIFGAFASLGGLSYAATSTTVAAKAVKRVVVARTPLVVQQSPAGDQYTRTVTICHRPPGNPSNTQTITVSESAVPAHRGHGDTLGACPPPAPAAVLGVRATSPGGAAPPSRPREGAPSGTQATATVQTLPFTGLPLGLTVLLSLALMATGVALRRRAGRAA